MMYEIVKNEELINLNLVTNVVVVDNWLLVCFDDTQAKFEFESNEKAVAKMHEIKIAYNNKGRNVLLG